MAGNWLETYISCCGRAYGSGRKMTALTMEKMAVFAPDAERRRQDGHDGESGAAHEAPHGVPTIAKAITHVRSQPVAA